MQGISDVPTDRDPAPAAIWRPFTSPALISEPIVQCLIMIVLTSIVFLAFPGIDPWFSGLFYKPGSGFVVGQLQAFIAFRNLLRDVTAIIPITLVVLLLIKLAWPMRKTLLRPCDITYILATLAVGPGIVTNLIFKNNWGRPRPYRVTDFGGDLPFVGAWKITHYCATNCSFVSGEASSAMWLLTLVVLVPERWRPDAVKALAVLAVLLSLNRVAFGGHFLSDIVLAWWITLLVMAVLYRLLYVNPPAALTNDQLEDGLTRAGFGLRDAVRTAAASISGKPRA